jgi:hypothetical protein
MLKEYGEVRDVAMQQCIIGNAAWAKAAMALPPPAPAAEEAS